MFSLDPLSKDFLPSLEFLLKVIGGCGGLILFVIGYRRYKKDQVWKRSEFLAKEMKDFTSDKTVRSTMYMLDWGARRIELFPDKENYDDRFAKVDRQVLQQALVFHKARPKQDGKDRFTPVEVAIRDHFDHFLSYFERFDQFIEARLFTKEDIHPYIAYWIDSISHELEDATKAALWNFIHVYGYSGTQRLFARFGEDITPVQ